MKILVESGTLRCGHDGLVTNRASRPWVRVNGSPVLVDNDPAGRPISRCPNVGATMKPCTSTLQVQTGYSTFLRVDGQAICLDTVTGLTDGTPPGGVKYTVRDAGQTLVQGTS